MSDILTKEERDQIRARCEAATEGPWGRYNSTDVIHSDNIGEARHGHLIADCDYEPDEGGTPWEERKTNAAFIAHARQDLPRALDTIDELESTVERIKKQLDTLRSDRDAELDEWQEALTTLEKLRADHTVKAEEYVLLKLFHRSVTNDIKYFKGVEDLDAATVIWSIEKTLELHNESMSNEEALNE